MKFRVDCIELLDAEATIVTQALLDASKDAHQVASPGGLVVHESITAEVNGSVLNYWTEEGGVKYAHTYHGAFLVHWHLPDSKREGNNP